MEALKGLVKINEENCKVCYACVRACPVNAIRVTSENASPEIMPARCIACGSCIKVCTPDAIEYKDSRNEVLAILESGQKSAAVVDPTIAAEFPDITDYRKFVRMIRILGFDMVFEGAFGVDVVAYKYKELIENNKGKYYIFANDPVVNAYIEKYQPELIPNLARISTPQVAMAKIIRELHGEEVRVVYIGPLIASKFTEEMGNGSGKLDAVLTFSELRELFIDREIDQKQLEFSEFDPPFGARGHLFPMASGILYAGELNHDPVKAEITTVEGESEMKEALREFQQSIEVINSHFNIFYSEYLMGVGTTKGGQRYLRQAEVKNYTRKRLKSLDMKVWKGNLERFIVSDLSRDFKLDDQRLPQPAEEEIKDIMKKLKQDCDQTAGCGVCGYDTCRDFAIAIAKGLAVPEMCNTFTNRNRQNYIESLKISNEKLAQTEKALRESETKAKTEKESAREASEIISAMLQKLPSGIVILDEKLKIIQANQSFIDLLGEDAKEINEIIPGLKGADLKTLLPYNIYNLFTYVLSNNENIQNRDISYEERLLNVSVFIIRKARIVGAVFRDMYSPEVRKEEVIKRVSEVIDKNLSLVQQIGFLLGEGASETEKMLNSIIEFYRDPGRKGS